MSQNTIRRSKKGKADYGFFISLIIIIVIGLLTLLSASAPIAMANGYSNYYYVKRQISIGIIGLIFAIIIYNIDFKVIEKLLVNKTMMYIIYVVLLALTLSVKFFGAESKGAVRWIRIGPINLQPSEFVKLGLIFFVAIYLTITIKEKKIGEFWRGFLLPMILVGVILGLTYKIQNHLSATALMGATTIVQMIVAGARIIYIVLAGIIVMIAAYFMFKKSASSGGGFRASRIKVWRNPFDYRKTGGWQPIQSLYALASGRFFGAGIGESRQKLSYLPEAHNDFIFSVFAEETGFLGVTIMIIIFIYFIARGFMIANSASDTFSRLVATGIITILSLQIIGNLAVVSNTIPVTGISLPFFSYGGTALIVNLMEVAILLNISKNCSNKNIKEKI